MIIIISDLLETSKEAFTYSKQVQCIKWSKIKTLYVIIQQLVPLSAVSSKQSLGCDILHSRSCSRKHPFLQ